MAEDAADPRCWPSPTFLSFGGSEAVSNDADAEKFADSVLGIDASEISAGGESQGTASQGGSSPEQQRPEGEGKSALPPSQTNKAITVVSADENISDSKSTSSEQGPNKNRKGKRERNKVAASNYRKRRKQYLQGLESQLKEIQEEKDQLKSNNMMLYHQNVYLMQQVAHLKSLVCMGGSSSGGVCRHCKRPGLSASLGMVVMVLTLSMTVLAPVMHTHYYVEPASRIAPFGGAHSERSASRTGSLSLSSSSSSAAEAPSNFAEIELGTSDRLSKASPSLAASASGQAGRSASTPASASSSGEPAPSEGSLEMATMSWAMGKITRVSRERPGDASEGYDRAAAPVAARHDPDAQSRNSRARERSTSDAPDEGSAVEERQQQRFKVALDQMHRLGVPSTLEDSSERQLKDADVARIEGRCRFVTMKGLNVTRAGLTAGQIVDLDDEDFCNKLGCTPKELRDLEALTGT